MTPLIGELSIQAGLACDGTDFDDLAVQTFAEMIIEECIKAVEKTPAHGYTTFDQAVMDGTKQRSIRSIKEHFGIKVL
jgi:hypothetical protein